MDQRILVVDMEMRGEAFAARVAELLGPLGLETLVITHEPASMTENMADLVRAAEAARHAPIIVFDDCDLLGGEPMMRQHADHSLRIRMEEDLHRAMARTLTRALTKEPPHQEKGWYRKFERRRLR